MTIPELLEWVKSLGTAAGPIFALLWWLERQERMDAQKETNQIAKDSNTSIIKTENTLSQLLSVLKSGSYKK